jgi:hypothetical protein
MLTTRQIQALIANPNPRQVRSQAMAFRQLRNASPAQRPLLEDLIAADLPTRQSYPHPADGILQRPPHGPLSPAEHAWLARTFPPGVDPAAVAHADAAALARLAASRFADKTDGQLVASIWAPIRDFHDGQAAALAVAEAARPSAKLPPSVLNAMLDAVAAETTGLSPDEQLTRASQLVHDAVGAHAATRGATLATAQHQAMSVAAAVYDRTAPTPGPQPAYTG